MNTAVVRGMWVPRLLLLVCSLLVFTSAMQAQQNAEEVLTNQSVVKMVKNGLSPTVVVDMIRAYPGRYQLNYEDVIELKREGVPATVLSAMIDKGRQAAASPSRPEISPNTCNPGADGIWSFKPESDPLTGKPSVVAWTNYGAADEAYTCVRAECSRDDKLGPLLSSFPELLGGMILKAGGAAVQSPQPAPPKGGPQLDTRALSFQFTYHPRQGSGISLQQESLPVVADVHDNEWLGMDNTITIGGGGTCPYLRNLRIEVSNQTLVHNRLRSEICNQNQPNLAAMSFLGYRERDLWNMIIAGAPKGNLKDNPAMKMLMNLFGEAAEMSDPTIATIDEAMRANSIQLALPLSDRSAFPVTIHPQEPSFRKFVAACNAEFPPPPPPVVVPSPADKFAAEQQRLRSQLPPPPHYPQHNGTAEGFASAFPKLLAQAALAHGLDPHDYEKETQYIIDTIRTCAQITPQMAASVRDRYGRVLLGKLGEQYKFCQSGASASDQVKQWNQQTERGITFRIAPADFTWQNVRGFQVQATFYGMHTDGIPIVRADIQPTQSGSLADCEPHTVQGPDGAAANCTKASRN